MTASDAVEEPGEDAPDDATALSARRRRAEVDDDTAPSSRARTAGADTVAEDEDTVLRPPRRASPQQSAPEADEAILRRAHVPDASALRAPSKPRQLPVDATIRTPAPPRPPSPGIPASVPDRESVERAVRTRARRRALVVVLCAAAGAVAATAALVLLLT